MKKFSAFLTVFLLLPLGGCFGVQSQEELERLVKEDPAFKQMIAVRDQAHSQIGLIRGDLLARKKTVDTQIDKLRAEYDAYAKSQNKKIEQFQASIEANRTLLKKEIETTTAALESKQTEVAGYQKTLEDVKKVLREAKGIRLSSQERQKWEERILMLSEKIRPLVEEIQELKLQIRLKKQKSTYLR